MKIGQKIREEREKRKISQAQLGKAVGISQAAIAKIEDGITVKSKHLPDLFEYLQIEIAKSAEQKKLRGELRNTIVEIDARMGAGGGGLNMGSSDSFGEMLDVDGEARKAEWLLPAEITGQVLKARPEHLRIFEVVGDSMEPRLSEGDRVFVDTRYRYPAPEGIFALWDGYGLVIKRLQIIRDSEPLRIKIISVNQSYDAYDATEDQINIIGRYAGRFTTN